jgi:hypothetical protein
LLVAWQSVAQSIDAANLEKYWKYRDQLKTRFMRIDTLAGWGIPASAIIPHRQYGQSEQSKGNFHVAE